MNFSFSDIIMFATLIVAVLAYTEKTVSIRVNAWIDVYEYIIKAANKQGAL